jgi:hypothetical protein
MALILGDLMGKALKEISAYNTSMDNGKPKLRGN